MSQDITQLFAKPGVSYRGKPFWSWNGKLEKEELIRQVHVMKEMGLGGFFMHSRTGLATEYLGEEWFELINACADEAEKLGMEAWLYDEDRWPSGTAGGMVTKEERFRLKFIRCRAVAGTDFEWNDELIAAFSCKLDGVDVSDCVRLSSKSLPEDYSEKTVLTFFVEEMAKDAFYNGYTYVDTMNLEATEKFIELTHEKYKEQCGDRLGDSIKGIFTDEPYRGAVMEWFGTENDESHWMVPWTYTLFEDFEKAFGYDVVERLPELFLRLDGKPVSQVKWHFIELLDRLFLERWAVPVNDWCEDNNIKLTGHILHEDNLTAQTALTGSVMRFYEHMGWPGVDVLSEQNRNYWVAKQVASVGRQLGKPWLLSELYGCTGWQMSFEAHKAVGDWQALFGINVRCHHLSWYTMKGEAKRDFPASILHQSAWWEQYEYVESYFARLGVMLAQGSPCCDILVLNPVESVWARVYPGWSQMLDPKDSLIRDLEERYHQVFHGLCGAQIDFDYADEEMLSRLASVDSGVIRFPGAQYKCVVVSGLTTIRSSTLKLLKEFIASGGKVIFAGSAPEYVDALPSDEAATLANQAIEIDDDLVKLVETCESHVGRVVEVVDRQTGERLTNVFAQARHDGEKLYIVAMSMDREEWIRDCLVRIHTLGNVEQWDCGSGNRYRVSPTVKDGCLEIPVDFPPSGEKAFVVTKVEDKSIPELPVYQEVRKMELAEPFRYTLKEPNVCVLDFARFRLDDGDWSSRMEILKVDRAVRDALSVPRRSGTMLQPWFTAGENGKNLAKLTLEYTFDVETIPSEPIELVVEEPGGMKIELNGQAVDVPENPECWLDVCFKRIPVNPDMLQVGNNVLQIELDFNEAREIEAAYLLGDFGVTLDGSSATLTRLPETLQAEDLTGQGLPFYTGRVDYHVDCDFDLDETERAFVEVPSFEAACITAGSPNQEAGIIGWQPYELDITKSLKNGTQIDIGVVLTRRNTFGPFHQIPMIAPGYGPDNFVTEGDQFTENYQLFPSGLLETPRISVRK